MNPGFGKTGKPADFLLTKNPMPGFDYTKTNDTIRHAGRDTVCPTRRKCRTPFRRILLRSSSCVDTLVCALEEPHVRKSSRL